MTDMTDLLRDCLEAFEAIPVAAKSRKVLKKIGQEPVSYAGNGSHILATHYAGVIRRRLAEIESEAP
jgi:hypothetical protein